MRDLPLYVGFRILSGLIGALPEPVARRLGEGLGWLLSFFAPARMALMERHLQRVTESEKPLRRQGTANVRQLRQVLGGGLLGSTTA